MYIIPLKVGNCGNRGGILYEVFFENCEAFELIQKFQEFCKFALYDKKKSAKSTCIRHFNRF